MEKSFPTSRDHNMGRYLQLAFRNVWRNRRRTVITFTAISLGLAAMIVGKSLMDGVDLDSQKNIINAETAHIKIFADGYFEKRDELPLNPTIANPRGIITALDSIQFIVGATPRIIFGGLLIGTTGDIGCMCIGVEPGTDSSVFNYQGALVEGSFFTPGVESAVIGIDLARDFDLKLHDVITIEIMMADSARNALDLEIIGLFETAHPAIDKSVIMLPLDVAAAALNLDTQVTEIAIKVQNLKRIKKISNTIISSLKKSGFTHKVSRWDELAGDFLKISQLKVQFLAIISLVMIIIATFGIVNTMLMSTIERTREIGTMAAIGMKRRQIMWLFVCESAIIGALGSVLGCIVGGGCALYLEKYGFDITTLDESLQRIWTSAYPVKNTYFADLRLDILIATFIFGIIVSTLVGIYASWRAAKLEPTEALRYI